MALEHERPPAAPGQQVQPCLQDPIPARGCSWEQGGHSQKCFKAGVGVERFGTVFLGGGGLKVQPSLAADSCTICFLKHFLCSRSVGGAVPAQESWGRHRACVGIVAAGSGTLTGHSVPFLLCLYEWVSKTSTVSSCSSHHEHAQEEICSSQFPHRGFGCLESLSSGAEMLLSHSSVAVLVSVLPSWCLPTEGSCRSFCRCKPGLCQTPLVLLLLPCFLCSRSSQCSWRVGCFAVSLAHFLHLKSLMATCCCSSTWIWELSYVSLLVACGCLSGLCVGAQTFVILG